MKLKKYKNYNCLICEKAMIKIINLPKFPITEFFIKKNQHLNNNYFVNQGLLFCNDCEHLTVENTIDPEFIYSNYSMTSNKSAGAMDCLINFFNFFKKDNVNFKNANIIDIGGNDSSFLKFFKARSLINIDPNAKTDSVNIKIRKIFFEKIDFSEFKSNFPNIFFSSHTIEHLERPEKLIKNLSKHLKKEDLIYLQFPCLEQMIFNKRFDQICHQHINLFSINSINKILNQNNLYINNYEYDEINFGTLRLKVSKIKTKEIKVNYNINIKMIKKNFSSFCAFYKKFSEYYSDIFINGCGYGAGLLVPVLSYFMPIINHLDIIYDDNKEKFNKKFITLKALICDGREIDKDKPILITSINSRIAVQNIYNKLKKIGVSKISSPSIFI